MRPQTALFIAFLSLVVPLLVLLFSPLIVYTSFMRTRAQRRNPVKDGGDEHLLARKIVEPQGEWNKKIVFFLHGWPDDISLFYPAAEFFSKNGFKCVCMGLPNYRVPKQFDGIEATLPPHRRYGFAFREMTRLVKNTVSHVLKETSGTEESILIGHDWGAMISYMYLEEFPGTISRLATFDVGLNDPKESNAASTSFTLAYFGVLNLAFLFPSWTGIGDFICRRLGSVMGWPKRKYAHPPHQSQCFVYREMYRELFWVKRENMVRLAKWRPQNFPFLFLICEKSLKFYGEPFLKKVRESHPTLGMVTKIPDTHWSWYDKEERFKIVLDFLNKPK